MRTSTLVILAMFASVGCTKDDETDVDTSDSDADTDADTDSDTDADTDADTDTDTDADTDSDADTDTGIDTDTGVDTDVPLDRLVSGNEGGAVAITSDDLVAVACNRTAGEITIFDLDLAATIPTGTLAHTIAVPGAQPWAAVIGNDDDTAYVVLRNSGEVIRISELRAAPTVFATRATVDAEPSGIAISEDGEWLYVTNWNAGTVSVIDADTMTVDHVIDLNAALIASGVLGSSVTTSRPGLAHPYGVSVVGEGATERVFVTEFYSQDLPSANFTTDDSYFDVGRQGLVYWWSTTTETVNTLTLEPIADTGFADSNLAATGCFPNQLFTAVENGGRVYVTGICASPRGPAGAPAGDANNKTKIHSAIWTIDAAATVPVEVPAKRVLLSKKFDELYATALTADDNTRRYPLIPNAMAFAFGTNAAYITGYGSDAVFRSAFNADGTFQRVGSSTQNFIELATGTLPGALPIGIATSNLTNTRAVVLNENSRTLSFVDLSVQNVAGAVAAATPVAAGAETTLNKGKKFFVTGKGRWSRKGQAWNSCEGCHPFGLTDNVTWYFPNGPRQTTSLDGSFATDPANSTQQIQRLFNWAAILDEVSDFEDNTRGVSGGVGGLVHVTGSTIAPADRIILEGTAGAGQAKTTSQQSKLFGSTMDVINAGVPGTLADGTTTGTVQSVLTDWNEIDAYIRTIRAPNQPNLAAYTADVTAGAALFTANGCNGCHGGALWTISERFYTPSQAKTLAGGPIDTTTYVRGTLPAALNPPSAAGAAALRTPTSGAAIQCALRAVGTFPATGTDGVEVAGGPDVSERKEDMTAVAFGAAGMSPPALIGMGPGAPYFHAGNARTLEEVLDSTFVTHYQALGSNFNPSAAEKRQMALFLISVDDSTTPVTKAVSTTTTVICPSTL